jgi:SAM-dependent methyltransferase
LRGCRLPANSVYQARLFLIAGSHAPPLHHRRVVAESARRPDRPGAQLLFPASIPLDLSRFVANHAYGGEIGLEKNSELWQSYRQTEFSEIVILGVEPLVDREEIVLACFLNARVKVHVDGRGQVRDLAPWQAQMRPDFRPREVRMRRLGEAAQDDYLRRVHKWLSDEMVAAGYQRPKPAPRDPDVSGYTAPRLAADLSQQTLDLQRENHGASFSTLMYLDGTLVHSSDFYRAMANYIMGIEGIESVLDVGCGSGFLCNFLAASERYRSVRGVDSSPHRIAGARLHAALTGSTATFDVTTMTRIDAPDASVDLVVTCFALEQSGSHLPRAIAELRRVARKMLVLFEPSTQFFATLPSLWNVPQRGWADGYLETLTALGRPFAMRPNLLSQYYNPGTVFVVDLESDGDLRQRLPALFRPAPEAWPGGVSVA